MCEYTGMLISKSDVPKSAKTKFPPAIEDWSLSQNCFAFFFKTLNGATWCIDGEEATGPARKINHSRLGANVKPFVNEDTPKKPRLFFKAMRDIEVGEELLYDYGEREKSIMKVHPWLHN